MILLAFFGGILVGALIGGWFSAYVFYNLGYNTRKQAEYLKLYGGRKPNVQETDGNVDGCRVVDICSCHGKDHT